MTDDVTFPGIHSKIWFYLSFKLLPIWQKHLKICFSHLFTVVREEPKIRNRKEQRVRGETGKGRWEESFWDVQGLHCLPKTDVHIDVWPASFCCIHKPRGLLLCGWGVVYPLWAGHSYLSLQQKSAHTLAVPRLILNLLHPQCSFCLEHAFPQLICPICSSLSQSVTFSERPSRAHTSLVLFLQGTCNNCS